MNVSNYLADLRKRDIQVWSEGEELRCRAGPGVVTPDLRGQLLQHKREIIAFLRAAQAVASQQSAIVPLQKNGDKAPIFAVPGHNGDVFCYLALSRSLGSGQPFFGMQPPGLDGRSVPLTSVKELARCYGDQIQAFRPNGRLIIAGFCAGGTVAFELARHLHAEGRSVALLALFGSPFPTFFRPLPQLQYRVVRKVETWRRHARTLVAMKPWRDRLQYVQAHLGKTPAAESPATDPVLALRARMEQITVAAVRAYTPEYFPGRVQLFMPCKAWAKTAFSGERWASVASIAETAFGPDGCTADDMLLAPYAPVFANYFQRSFARH